MKGSNFDDAIFLLKSRRSKLTKKRVTKTVRINVEFVEIIRDNKLKLAETINAALEMYLRYRGFLK